MPDPVNNLRDWRKAPENVKRAAFRIWLRQFWQGKQPAKPLGPIEAVLGEMQRAGNESVKGKEWERRR